MSFHTFKAVEGFVHLSPSSKIAKRALKLFTAVYLLGRATSININTAINLAAALHVCWGTSTPDPVSDMQDTPRRPIILIERR